MNEAKAIAKHRKQVTVRKNTPSTELAIWCLVALEAVRLALPYIEGVL